MWVVYNIVCMGYTNNTGCVLICAVYNKKNRLEKVFTELL